MDSDSKLRGEIQVTDIAISNARKITVHFRVSRPLRRFFLKDHACATYESPIRNLPESILVVPFLSLVMPIAWVLDATVKVNDVDTAFADALERIRARFQEMYPEVPFRGELLAAKRTTLRAQMTQTNGVLFSGGIDSTASAIHHRNEKLGLFSVISDRDSTKGFSHWISDYNREFAPVIGAESHVVRADLNTVFDAPLVCSLHKHYIHDWWAGIQHSLYFAGACAPIATMRNCGKFYVPSSHSVGQEWLRWGSHPKIDNEIAWGNSRVVHDLYEFGRQKKVSVVAGFLRTEPNKLKICVCEMLKDIGGKNCSACEKCFRTMVGLALAGVDPNDLGFEFNEKSLDRIKRDIFSGQMILTSGKLTLWSELQAAINDDEILRSYGMPEFTRWFQDTKLFLNEKIATRMAVYRTFVQWSALLPSFIRRPLRNLVLHFRGVPQ
jgi:hypothetical protein